MSVVLPFSRRRSNLGGNEAANVKVGSVRRVTPRPSGRGEPKSRSVTVGPRDRFSAGPSAHSADLPLYRVPAYSMVSLRRGTASLYRDDRVQQMRRQYHADVAGAAVTITWAVQGVSCSRRRLDDGRYEIITHNGAAGRRGARQRDRACRGECRQPRWLGSR